MSNLIANEKILLSNNSSNQDAFDRLRISEPNTLFQYELSLGKLPFIMDELISGSGATIISDTSIPTIDLKLTGTGGATGKAIRQSYEYIPYQPGKSKFLLLSGILEAENGGITGVVSRIGCFDSSVEKTSIAGNGNGLFFELGGTSGKTLSVVERLNDVDTKVIQNDWNYDKFDGTGPSGITALDFSKGMIFGIDQEWLGTGRVRFGFVINGSFKLGHSFNHSASNAIQLPYTKTAKLPIRYEISSTVANTATMRMLSSIVLSEGGYEPTGLSFSRGRSVGKNVNTTLVPIISIKLREQEPYNRKTISMRKVSILVSTAKSIQWDLYILPNSSYLTDASWVNQDTNNSIAQYDISSTAVNLTDGIQLVSGYVNDTTISDFFYDKYLESSLINSSISGTSKVLCLAAVKLPGQSAGNVTTHGSISWVEII